MTTTRKTVNLNLVGLESNAFSLLGAFERQARQEQWTSAEIEAVTKDAMSGDYEHLLGTLAAYCSPTSENAEGN